LLEIFRRREERYEDGFVSERNGRDSLCITPETWGGGHFPKENFGGVFAGHMGGMMRETAVVGKGLCN